MIARYCRPFGMLGVLPGVDIGKGTGDVGETSSKRSNTTTFGSVRVCVNDRLGGGVWFVKLLAWDCTLIRRLPGEDDVAAYSGNSEKLSGVTTTPKVPGRCVSAFRSLSSSVVST